MLSISLCFGYSDINIVKPSELIKSMELTISQHLKILSCFLSEDVTLLVDPITVVECAACGLGAGPAGPLEHAMVHQLDCQHNMQATQHMPGHIFLLISYSLLKVNQDALTVNSTIWI